MSFAFTYFAWYFAIHKFLFFLLFSFVIFSYCFHLASLLGSIDVSTSANLLLLFRYGLRFVNETVFSHTHFDSMLNIFRQCLLVGIGTLFMKMESESSVRQLFAVGVNSGETRTVGHFQVWDRRNFVDTLIICSTEKEKYCRRLTTEVENYLDPAHTSSMISCLDYFVFSLRSM